MNSFKLVIALILIGLCISGVQATLTKTETTDGAYTVIKWTTNLTPGGGQDTTTWDADAAGVSEVQYLVVAGGGSAGTRTDGANYYLGGGGAGGMREGTEFAVSGNITIKVGAGASRPTTYAQGNQGAASQFSTITSDGGGYGGYPDANGGSGGSGGGAGGNDLATTGGAATSGQGSAGGNHAAGSSTGGAGGGGAGGAGGANSGLTGGTGGAAKASNITGSSAYYAAGGAGGAGYGGSVGSDGTGYSRDGYGMGGRGDTAASGTGTGTNGVVIVRFLTPKPFIVSFIASPTTGSNPLTVSFNDTTTSDATILSYNVSFGDGSWWNKTTFPATNITHIYSTAGNYTVDWYVRNSAGAGSANTTITVWGAAHSEFTAFRLTGTSPHTTFLHDTSTNLTPGPVTYGWDLGDGNTSAEQDLYYTWNGTGTYSVNHSVSNGLSTSYSEQTITIEPSILPMASFYATNQLGPVALNVSFKDASAGYPISWLWDFGDGSNSTSQNPYHTYTRSGIFNVTLSVENHAGTNETMRAKFVTVV